MVDIDIPGEHRSVGHFLRLHAQDRPEKLFADIVGTSLTFGQAKSQVWAYMTGSRRHF